MDLWHSTACQFMQVPLTATALTAMALCGQALRLHLPNTFWASNSFYCLVQHARPLFAASVQPHVRLVEEVSTHVRLMHAIPARKGRLPFVTPHMQHCAKPFILRVLPGQAHHRAIMSTNCACALNCRCAGPALPSCAARYFRQRYRIAQSKRAWMSKHWTQLGALVKCALVRFAARFGLAACHQRH